jgi:tyrosine decarboxylase/aspartate 1-decarboxylase
LVPQKHHGDNSWYKIVIMDHVEVDHLSTFITDLKESLYVEKNITNEI